MKFKAFVAVLALTLFASAAQARDDVLTLPLQELLDSADAKSVLLDVPIYFAGQSHPEVERSKEVTTSRKTNAFNKSDEEACRWVMLSALKVLQDAAQKQGYDAVVNIRSNYKHNEFASDSEYQCGAGTFIAGAALKADLAHFADK
ncbi:excinuclease ABC subunit A [Pseudidiomarina sediminum]|uniref:Excinuclease ABC subunit A n=1 Tax=Pseudidiomarina sediminum TaxID=431675 RepID=A0A432Z2A1_9GAMM|nr:excinuclease ABC subunit A [Pseudidiomarina sediminum]RUO72028.1 excinuclease ABC subunit A [Pseudidiomarina sediminum]